MSYEAKIIADSISPAGIRLTTLQVTFPHFLLAEFNTHRMLSRNSASSRAIPVRKRIEAVLNDPFIPDVFGKNKKGMQSTDEVFDQAAARRVWMSACKSAITHTASMDRNEVHKQIANRLLEPFSWHTVVVTATDWSNFFHLRCHPDAQPEFQKIAGMMRDAMITNTPQTLSVWDWHLPYIQKDELDNEHMQLALASAGRCARVSYLTHQGIRELDADLDLARRLLKAGHMSPFEHPAYCHDKPRRSGNFFGWQQYRKLIPGESDPLGTHHD